VRCGDLRERLGQDVRVVARALPGRSRTASISPVLCRVTSPWAGSVMAAMSGPQVQASGPGRGGGHDHLDALVGDPPRASITPAWRRV
jgi:hypothetical protein